MMSKPKFRNARHEELWTAAGVINQSIDVIRTAYQAVADGKSWGGQPGAAEAVSDIEAAIEDILESIFADPLGSRERAVIIEAVGGIQDWLSTVMHGQLRDEPHSRYLRVMIGEPRFD
ncbi:hypothetical protein [Azospirillum brasilense]|uniref:hypothetical protein n=1 Tax=Azospirillum brasilense TaxID=192 RepID=UPI000E676AC3|nr:hypothetical protein [Azospirillum brasilense]NUB23330.1 hypothetical protein [Azospirillum brasilense]NUB30952.1 hypothetical protein [Azospirillum brasilense]RIW05665.1 hypothetical protein D2T81_07415 [Azospirillum brasilense]